MDLHLDEIDALAVRLTTETRDVPGYLTDREARHLVMLAQLTPAEGDLLEIGSFMGKSTILLARAIKNISSLAKIVAVDPLTQPSETDPDMEHNRTSRDDFFANLKTARVDNLVEFHEKYSTDLAQNWNRPLRLLWIDGDHTYDGVRADFDGFAHHLSPGGIIAMHDLMHGFRGPDHVFIEEILLSAEFGAAGIVGSIGWAQKSPATPSQKSANKILANRLQSWLDAAPKTGRATGLRKLWVKFKRFQVPHAAINAVMLNDQLS